MALVDIDALLERYFEGTTSVEEETALHHYFENETVAPHLEQYIPLFKGFAAAREETSTKPIKLPEVSKENRKRMKFNWSAAAAIAVLITAAGWTYQNYQYQQEQAQAQAVYTQTKEALILLSHNLNKGTEELAHLNQFTKTKNKYFK